MTNRPDHDHDALVLVGRLDTGWSLIDREPDLERRSRLEGHWLTLLSRYEQVCDGADHHADDRVVVGGRHGE